MGEIDESLNPAAEGGKRPCEPGKKGFCRPPAALAYLLLIFSSACYESREPAIHDVSIEEAGQESVDEADMDEEDPAAGDPEIIDAESDAPSDGLELIDAQPDVPDICAEGLFPCGGVCVDLASDPFHCGGCGVICPDRPNAHPVCVDGACSIECDAGYEDCNGTMLDGCESCDVARPEECNGVDDDMDGAIDEDFECPAEMRQSCTTACGTSGFRKCSDVDCTWSMCCSTEETCGNACDDNCDGILDEGCP